MDGLGGKLAHRESDFEEGSAFLGGVCEVWAERSGLFSLFFEERWVYGRGFEKGWEGLEWE